MLELGPASIGAIGGVCYGCGDFAGGWANRRLSSFGVLLSGQAVAASLAIWLAAGGPVTAVLLTLANAPLVAWSAAGGLFHLLGIAALYAGFARGRVSIVAPISGICNLLVAWLFDITFIGPVRPVEMMGVGLAVVSIICITARMRGDTSDQSAVRRSLLLGLLSGVAFGAADALLGAVPAASAITSLAIARTASIGFMLAIGCAVLLLSWRHRSPMRAVGGCRLGWLAAIGLAVLSGIGDAAGHASYVVSASLGSISTASALTALYPGVSILLGVWLFKERINHSQFAGLAIIGLCVVLLN